MPYKVTVYLKLPENINMTEREQQLLLARNGVPSSRVLMFKNEELFYHYVRKFDYLIQNRERRNYFLDALMAFETDSLRHKKTFFYRNCMYTYYLGYRLEDIYFSSFVGYHSVDYEIINLNDYKMSGYIHRLSKTYINNDTYQMMRTYQERRYACDPEHKPYIRGKRRHLPDPWDEKVRTFDFNWKRRIKVKRQWQVNKRIHKDTVIYRKRLYDEELFMEYYYNPANIN
jgi:hypothetical protein